VIDEATSELLHKDIKNKLETMTNSEFNSAKRKNFDTLSFSRLDLSKISKRYFDAITEENFKFDNFNIIEKFSKGIKKIDILKFFDNHFIEKENLKFTIYMYSQEVARDQMKNFSDEYEEIFEK
jgi:secreted Zn-dependent insulinase-like peptidase